jgi:glycosyltransferase involved in cell wall biosynthesis
MYILHCDFSRDWRGGQQQLVLLHRELAALGAQQGVVVRSRMLAELYGDTGMLPLFTGAETRRLARGADAVHAHDGRAHSWMLAVLAGNRRTIRVLTRRVAFAIPAMSRFKYRATDAVLAVSQFVQKRVLDTGIREERTSVVYDGIDLSSLPTAGVPVIFGGADPAARVNLTVVAAFAPEKGVADALRALAVLPPRFHLHLMPGPGAEEMIALARTLGISGRVHLAPRNVRVPELIAAGDLFLLPSRAEGLGSSTLVAMALGRPVVATAVGGIPELVVDGETGYLAPPASPRDLAHAIEAVVADPARARRCADRARARVEVEFTSARMAALTLHAYRAALARRRS